MRTFIAHFLFLLAAWTVVIKYLFPMGYSLAYGEPILAHVYLDLWPVVHVWVGWSLLHWNRYTFALAAITSLAEIAIVVTKFVGFLSAPEWNIFRTNWFINKIFVLACFILLLGYLVAQVRARASLAQPAPSPSR
jgi:hypothetical protein